MELVIINIPSKLVPVPVQYQVPVFENILLIFSVNLLISLEFIGASAQVNIEGGFGSDQKRTTSATLLPDAQSGIPTTDVT